MTLLPFFLRRCCRCAGKTLHDSPRGNHRISLAFALEAVAAFALQSKGLDHFQECPRGV